MITKIVNDPAIGQYVVNINHDNNIITTIVGTNVFMYKFDRDDLITELIEVAPNCDLDDFIVMVLGDDDLLNTHLEVIKSM